VSKPPKYPRINSSGRLPYLAPGEKRLCFACDASADHFIIMEFNILRSEDVEYRVCQQHLDVAIFYVGSFFDAVKNKSGIPTGGTPAPTEKQTELI